MSVGAGSRAGTVWVVGSINRDLVIAVERLPGRGETVLGADAAWHGGGKGANQATAAARDGARVRMVGAVGRDAAGEAGLAELASDGVDTSGVARLAGVPSGIAVVLLEASGENQIVVAAGANGALEGAAVRAALEPAASAGDVVLASLEVPDAAVVAAAVVAAARGLRLVVNPAPARRLPAAILDARPILTPNRHELALLAEPPAEERGGPEAPEAAARRLAGRSGAPVVVTLGAAGCMLVEDDRIEAFPGVAVHAVDTTGAGDAFSGVLASSLARGLDLRTAIRRACAAGALATTALGARAGMAPAAAIDALARTGDA